MFENILDIQITSCDRPMDAVDIACGIGAVEVAGGVLHDFCGIQEIISPLLRKLKQHQIRMINLNVQNLDLVFCNAL